MLIPYVKKHPRVKVRDLAQELGVSQQSIIDLVDNSAELIRYIGIQQNGEWVEAPDVGDHTVGWCGEAHDFCTNCGVNTSKIGEWAYTVVRGVWDMVRDPKSFLCIGCLELEIGRRLVSEDFSDAPINTFDTEKGRHPRPRSARLRSRMK